MKRVALATVVLGAVASPLFAAGGLPGVKLPPHEKFRMKNGLDLILMEKHDVPLIAFHLRMAGGDAADSPGQEGTAGIVAEWIQKGAGRRDALAFSQAVDSVGGILTTTSDREAIEIEGEFLARDRALMLELLSDMLLRPRLDVASRHFQNGGSL